MPKRSTKPTDRRPVFRTDDEEQAFWATADVTDHFDFDQPRRVRFPALKPTTATISLRLPQGMLDELKVLANARDVPYQSLLKVFLSDRLAAERTGRPTARPSRRSAKAR